VLARAADVGAAVAAVLVAALGELDDEQLTIVIPISTAIPSFTARRMPPCSRRAGHARKPSWSADDDHAALGAARRAMGLFGNKGIKARCVRAVEPHLEAGEAVEAIVYARDPAGPGGGTAMFGLAGMAALSATPTFILALTASRLVVLQAHPTVLAKSPFLGAVERQRVRLVGDPGSAVRALTLSVDGDAGHTFAVPAAWRRDAADFAAALSAGSPR
jgi:hypothetical protein